MLKKKSQASLEYLSTYAWAFVVLIIIIGAVQYFGILDFKRYLPQKCVFSSQFKCTDYTARGGEIRIKVLNSINANLRLSDVILEDAERRQLACASKLVNGLPFNAEADWKNGEEIEVAFTGCQNDAQYIINERIEITARLRYYSPDTPVRNPIFHETRGKIIVVVK